MSFEDNSQYDGLSFYPFGQSDNQYAHRVITGRYAEHAIAVYDFYFAAGGAGGPTGSSNDVYFAMIVMELPNTVPWLHVTQRKNLHRHADDDAVSTGDEAFDSVYVLFARNQDYAKSAVSATVRSGLPAQALSGMHIVDGRLFLWQTRHRHDVAPARGPAAVRRHGGSRTPRPAVAHAAIVLLSTRPRQNGIGRTIRAIDSYETASRCRRSASLSGRLTLDGDTMGTGCRTHDVTAATTALS